MSTIVSNIPSSTVSVLEGITRDVDSLLQKPHNKRDVEKVARLLVKVLYSQQRELIGEISTNPERLIIIKKLGNKLKSLSAAIFKKRQHLLSNHSIRWFLGQIQNLAKKNVESVGFSKAESSEVSTINDGGKAAKKQRQISTDETDEAIIPLAKIHFGKKHISIYRKLVNSGYPITIGFFQECLLYQNLPMINFILSKVDKQWVKENAKTILSSILKTDDHNSTQMLFHHFPDIGAKCTLSIIEKAQSEGKTNFIIGMLEHGMRIKSKNLGSLIETAIKQNDLLLVQSLCQYAQSKKNRSASFYLQFSYPVILGLEKLKGLEHEKDRYQCLLGFALNSPMGEVYRLVQQYPEFSDVLPAVITASALLVRLPKSFRAEVNKKFDNATDFRNLSEDYAAENFDFINKIIPRLNTLSRDQFIDEIVKNRRSRNPGLNDEYSKKAIDHLNKETVTPLLAKVKTSDPTNKKMYNTCRYYKSLTHLMSSLYSPSKEGYRIPKRLSAHKQPHGLTFTYPLPTKRDTVDDVPLTRVNDYDAVADTMAWRHTTPLAVAKLQAHVEQLHRKLWDYKLDLTNVKNKKIFFEKVARAYWLTATLCERMRGTPHNAMIYLNAIYVHHGLPPPIPKLEHFFLDNTMLMMPIEHVIKKWETFFEPPWDQAIVAANDGERREIVKDLLKHNPELLRYSSNAVRNDPECLSVCKKEKADSKDRK